MFIQPQTQQLNKENGIERLLKCTSFKLNKKEILGRPAGEQPYCLGRYDTTERAKEVFLEIKQAIKMNEGLYEMPMQ